MPEQLILPLNVLCLTPFLGGFTVERDGRFIGWVWRDPEGYYPSRVPACDQRWTTPDAAAEAGL